MTNHPASVLQRQRELSHSFAVVAPLGGGAVMALHALQQDGAQGPLFACGSPVASAGMGPLALGPAAASRRQRERMGRDRSVPVRSPGGEALC
jgi:hypothetical protein